ncbi:hypothetical protein [Nocardia sp. NPDC057227]|uniref:hypothetical protein n=1 Tax=Nocardia sp. NPDC057227 TaxID=3346056 RepID=UPI003638005F
MTRAELEAYALELGWVINRRTSALDTVFSRDDHTLTVWWDDDDELWCARVREYGAPLLVSVAAVRKRLRELAGRYTPPASLLDTVAMAVDDEHPDLADLPTVEGER